MDEKREISLQRASQLHEEIEDYLAFKDDFLRNMTEIRDVISEKHKEELKKAIEKINILIKSFSFTPNNWVRLFFNLLLKDINIIIFLCLSDS